MTAPGIPLHPSARIRFHPLAIAPHDGEFLVGDPARGGFVALPEIGIVVLDALRDGHTLSEAASVAAERAGEEVDVLDFTTTLIDLGFGSHVDGVAVDARVTQRDDGEPRHAVLVDLARPLFSPAAWAVYAALFLVSVAVLIAAPDLRSDRSDPFFAGTPLESAVAVTLLSAAAAIVHRVTQLALKRPLVGLTDTEAAELRDASARDLQVARWYAGSSRGARTGGVVPDRVLRSLAGDAGDVDRREPLG